MKDHPEPFQGTYNAKPTYPPPPHRWPYPPTHDPELQLRLYCHPTIAKPHAPIDMYFANGGQDARRKTIALFQARHEIRQIDVVATSGRVIVRLISPAPNDNSPPWHNSQAALDSVAQVTQMPECLTVRRTSLDPKETKSTNRGATHAHPSR